MERSTVQSCLAAPFHLLEIRMNRHSRGTKRPSFALVRCPPLSKRAQGRPGADGHPRSAARKCSARRPHSSIQVTPNTRPSLRDGRAAYAVLSPETNSFCLRRLTEFTDTAPVDASAASARLDRSDDGQDHTVLPYAWAPFVRHGLCRAHGVRLNPPPALPSHPRRRCRVHRIPDPRS